jgi:hypothetical protein
MPAPRSSIVDETVTPWYHCISRCVRRAFLCGKGCNHRKQWIEDRLRQLVGLFAIDCASYAVLDNHLHVLVRLDWAKARDWSAEEVARRWLTLFPLRDTARRALPVSQARVEQLAQDAIWVAKVRGRLGNLGWFMKCLKEPLARMANKEDGCTGAFWEGRFKSIAVVDEESLLATAAYIDVNPVAAGLAATPEDAVHTSLRTRLAHCRDNGMLPSLCDDLSTLTCDPAIEAGLWLMPIDDHRPNGEGRVGMIAGCTLSCYLRLIDAISRVLRDGKASLGPELESIFQRLRLDQEAWQATVSKLLTRRDRIPSHLNSQWRAPCSVRAGKRPRFLDLPPRDPDAQCLRHASDRCAWLHAECAPRACDSISRASRVRHFHTRRA